MQSPLLRKSYSRKYYVSVIDYIYPVHTNIRIRLGLYPIGVHLQIAIYTRVVSFMAHVQMHNIYFTHNQNNNRVKLLGNTPSTISSQKQSKINNLHKPPYIPRL